MNDDTNQRAREILSERSGAAYQFEWDMQVVSLVAAEKAISQARAEALQEAASKILRRIEEAASTAVSEWQDAFVDGLQEALRVIDNSSSRLSAPAKTEVALIEALELFRGFGCPVCSGDCGSANPPASVCPMSQAEAAIRSAKA